MGGRGATHSDKKGGKSEIGRIQVSNTIRRVNSMIQHSIHPRHIESLMRAESRCQFRESKTILVSNANTRQEELIL
jgi:hypothetical protein